MAGAASVATLGVAGGLRLAHWRVVRRVARSRRLGRVGESRGRRLLERAGYRILDEQVSARGELKIDGRVERFLVRADALVERRRRRYVAEYKGGLDVARITHRATRRQLLEYAHVFDVHGVLLVDVPGGTVHHVEL